jgi:hypothetical protein
MSVDGSGYFSSHEIHCDNCGVKKHRDGSITYHHEMLAAVIVNPDIKQVIPLKPEPIIKQDGSSKNDCEINAVKRLLSDVRKDHSQLKITMVADGLYGKSTIIDMCRDLKYDFIIGAKPGDHVHLFEQFNSLNKSKDTNKLEIIENGVERTFEFVNNLELNKSNPDVKINFLFFVEKKKGKTIYFTWITSHLITQDNVYTIMRAGRARWKIENETFNTLKNKGYQFEHNFGHGYKHLSSVLACLMMLAFLIDQAQEITSQVVKKAIQLAERKCEFWKALKAYTFTQIFKTWDELYGVILQRFIDRRAFNTS